MAATNVVKIVRNRLKAANFGDQAGVHLIAPPFQLLYFTQLVIAIHG
jgi:hypothetical protein